MTNLTRTDDKLAELNQPPLWSGINAYRSDPLIVDLTGTLNRSVRDELDTLGRYVTSHEAQELARMANESAPKLRTHGPRGERIDVTEEQKEALDNSREEYSLWGETGASDAGGSGDLGNCGVVPTIEPPAPAA